jgi:hypothetical protein
MPTEYTCPACGFSVLLPNVAAEEVSPNEEMGCNNIGKHPGGDVVVMKPAE